MSLPYMEFVLVSGYNDKFLMILLFFPTISVSLPMYTVQYRRFDV